MEVTEKGKENDIQRAQPIPEQDNSSERILCNITYRSKRRIIPEDGLSLYPTKPDYAKSMADIFTDSTIAEKTMKSDYRKTKHNKQIDPSNSKSSEDNTEKEKSQHCDKCDHADRSKNSSRRNRQKCKCTTNRQNKNPASVSIQRKYFLRSKIVDLTDSNVSKKHAIRISKRNTEPTKDTDEQNVDSSNELIMKTRSIDKAVGTEEDKGRERGTDNCNEVEYLGMFILLPRSI